MISPSTYRSKIKGCWIGKAIGGTLGMPFEGHDGPFDLSYYNPVPTETVANDDLDLQILWAYVLDNMETLRVDRNVLARAWVEHVGFPWDEYAIAIRNIKLGLSPPLTGSYDNFFINGMGAAIRSEIWACLAPGNSSLAAAYAYEDACVDHAQDGLWAEVFLAALESAAFQESNINTLLDIALAELDHSSAISQCVTNTRRWYAELTDPMLVRQKILQNYENENFTDVVQNFGFIVLALLAGQGDFGKTICIATNCGKDTDCTAATVGAVMGIINPQGIEEKWSAPIGGKLLVSEPIRNITYPDTIEGFTDLIVDLHRRIAQENPPSLPQPCLDQLTDHAIPVSHTFVKSMPMELMDWSAAIERLQSAGTPKMFTGSLAMMKANEFKDDILMLKYKLHLDTTLDVRVVFNCSSTCMVWIDGTFTFGREGGRMAPSAHRCPINQFADIRLEKGEHELIAAVYKPNNADYVQWFCNLACRKDYQWLVEELQWCRL